MEVMKPLPQKMHIHTEFCLPFRGGGGIGGHLHSENAVAWSPAPTDYYSSPGQKSSWLLSYVSFKSKRPIVLPQANFPTFFLASPYGESSPLWGRTPERTVLELWLGVPTTLILKVECASECPGGLGLVKTDVGPRPPSFPCV